MADRCIRIVGGNPLTGTISVSGAKNSALPCLFATLLSGQESTLRNLPDVSDTKVALETLASLGHAYTYESGSAVISPSSANLGCEMPVELARAMRASILALGPLLTRHGQAIVPLPGGCDFGTRPIDIHLHGLKAMGAQIEMRGGVLHASTKGLQGAKLVLEYPTFTGTENLLMAAVLAKGETVIENAAQEPEVADLAKMLIGMGAKITGAGSATITVQGVAELNGANHSVKPDRIEAGTYLAATMATGGEITLQGAIAEDLALPLEKFAEAGAKLDIDANSIKLTMSGRPLAFSVTTAPYPGFPTDLQAQSLAVNCVADGTGEIVDQVWHKRFRTADELALLGAQITVHGNCATVIGVKNLVGAHVQASDLRASAALVIGGLAAQGETIIHGAHHLERGYDNLPGKLQSLGATVSKD